MSLIRTYTKIIISKNRFQYIMVVISIILSYLLLALTTVCANKIMILSSGSLYPEMHYLYISILTILLIAGASMIVYQYLNIMKTGLRDYYIQQGHRTTKRSIRHIILMQVVFLVIVSLPVGLLGGYFLSESVINLLRSISKNLILLGEVSSVTPLVFCAGVIGSFIVLIGIHLDVTVRKMPLDNILSDNFMINSVV